MDVPSHHDPNHRHFHRIEFITNAELLIGDKKYQTSLHDLSLKGAVVEIPNNCSLSKGMEIKLVFKLQGPNIPIEMSTSVDTIEGDRVGLFIHHIDINSISHLKRLIELNTGDAKLLERELEDLYGSNQDYINNLSHPSKEKG